MSLGAPSVSSVSLWFSIQTDDTVKLSMQFVATTTDLLVNPPDVSGEFDGNWPRQGKWTVEKYLELDRSVRRLIEYTDGVIEVLPYPTLLHQRILGRLLIAFSGFAKTRHLGDVLMSPCPVRLGPRLYRDPDVFLTKSVRPVAWNDQPDGAILVMEVVSPDPESRHRDYVRKVLDYAEVGIPEYWLADPESRQITVLSLDHGQYTVHGRFEQGAVASGALYPDFRVNTAELFHDE